METNNMAGRHVVITGGTSGIGRVTAERLADMGASVTIIGRNPEKLSATIQEIRTATGNNDVQGLQADLSSIRDVKRIAQEIHHQAGLDVLINNAGAFFTRRLVSVDGLEMTFALNHLAYFLLTRELLDLLTVSGSARIINVSSGAHVGARLDFSDLQNERAYFGWKVYAQSKLANLLFTYELARRLDGGVTVNALHPGFVRTNFGRSNGGLMGRFVAWSQRGAISPEAGAQTSIFLASSPEVAGITGGYFHRCMQVRSSAASYDAEAARRLWEVSEKLVDGSGH